MPAAPPQPAAGAPFAVDTLELGEVRERLARHTSFSASRALALALAPTGDLPEAQRRQDETTEALRLASLQPSLHFGGVHDVRPLLERASIGSMLRPDELLEVSSTVLAARRWRHALLGLIDHLPTLHALSSLYLRDHSGLAESIQGAISASGEVLDSASPTLHRIRSELRGAHDRLVARLREIMSRSPFADAVQDPVVTQRAGRYVIPIRAEARTQVPAIVHDQSASGATLFVEPLAVVDMANRWRTLVVEEEREVERVLRALTRQVGDEADALAASVEGLAILDLAQAKGRLAEQMRATAPSLVGTPRRVGDPVLVLRRARHPLLLGEPVPVSLELGGELDTLLITGPNTGGKTVALKTAGLLTLMAQCGLHVPADDGSLIAVFRRVQADIGDEQSLQQSLSTFSSHVTRIVRMLGDADTCSLVLLDELGAGTDPQEGAALARALLDFLRGRGAYVIATTHYPELKAYAHLTERVQNASVEFDVETLSPTYRLMVGVPGRSNALAIAERLGMPDQILEGARRNLSPRTAEVEALLGEIAQEKADAELGRQRVELDRQAAQRLMREARKALQDAERKRREIWEQARAEADRELGELRREALRLRQELGRRGAGAPRETVEAVLSLPTIKAPPMPRVAPPEPEPAESAVVRVGAEVMVPRLGLPGRITSIRDGSAEVEVMGRRVRLPLADLEGARRANAADRRAAEPVPAPRVAVASPVGTITYQLDLRGLRRDEALERLEQYLEEAHGAGMPQARIVHGKGTGAIRQAVRETLRASRAVRRYEPEPDAHGGDGATLIWFAE